MYIVRRFEIANRVIKRKRELQTVIGSVDIDICAKKFDVLLKLLLNSENSWCILFNCCSGECQSVRWNARLDVLAAVLLDTQFVRSDTRLASASRPVSSYCVTLITIWEE